MALEERVVGLTKSDDGQVLIVKEVWACKTQIQNIIKDRGLRRTICSSEKVLTTVVKNTGMLMSDLITKEYLPAKAKL